MINQIFEETRNGKLPRFWTFLLLSSNWEFNNVWKFIRQVWLWLMGIWFISAITDRLLHLNMIDFRPWPLATWGSLALFLVLSNSYFQTRLGEVYGKAYLFLTKEERYIPKAMLLAATLCVGQNTLSVLMLYFAWQGFIVTRSVFNWPNALTLVTFIIWVVILFLCASKLQKEDLWTDQHLPKRRNSKTQ